MLLRVEFSIKEISYGFVFPALLIGICSGICMIVRYCPFQSRFSSGIVLMELLK